MSDVFTDIMSCILATRHRARAPEDCNERSEGLEAKCANLTHALVSGHKQRPDVVTFDMLREGERINSEILASYAITKEQSDGLEKIYQAVRLAGLLGDAPREVSPDDSQRLTAIQWWNDGDSWGVVNSKLGRLPHEAKATEMELKRFAKKNSIDIREGKPGLKKRN